MRLLNFRGASLYVDLPTFQLCANFMILFQSERVDPTSHIQVAGILNPPLITYALCPLLKVFNSLECRALVSLHAREKKNECEKKMRMKYNVQVTCMPKNLPGIATAAFFSASSLVGLRPFVDIGLSHAMHVGIEARTLPNLVVAGMNTWSCFESAAFITSMTLATKMFLASRRIAPALGKVSLRAS